MKFTTKLLLIILSISVISIITVSAISYSELLNLSGYSQDINMQLGFFASDNSKEALIKQAESYLSRLSRSHAVESNSTLERIQSEVIALTGFVEDIYKNPDNFAGRILPLPNEVQDGVPTAKIMVADGVTITPDIEKEMLLISNAEYMFGNILAIDSTLSNTYLGTDNGITFRYSISNAYDPDYDPRNRPWYIAAYNSEAPVWIETYVDIYGDIASTCAMSFRDADGNLRGAVAVDIFLSNMVEDILNVRIGETGYAFMLDETGKYLAHPHYSEAEKDAINNAQGDYKDVLTRMAAGDSDVALASIDGVEYYIAFSPLPVTGWSLGIVVEKDEVVAGALEMKEGIDKQAVEAKEEIRKTLNNVMFRFIAMLCVSVVAVLILSILISGSVTKPITNLTNGVIEVGKGNLESKLNIQTKDEIGILATNFNKMTDDLKSYITNLSKITAEKERIATELNVATQIQADMLPNIFPAFPDREEFDIYATMQPAKEVGGDFYDFFMIDEDHLCVVVADVSGKSVPAALFMVIAKTLINNRARMKENPQDVFTNVNTQLREGNETSMFVTAWMGILEISSGKLIYVNAGHNPPLLKRADGTFEYLKTKRGFVLAGMDGYKYKQQELELHKGDILYLYTDGVTEANNPKDELYGEVRLQNMLNELVGLPLDEILHKIKADIDLFADGTPQFDDITMLAVQVKL